MTRGNQVPAPDHPVGTTKREHDGQARAQRAWKGLKPKVAAAAGALLVGALIMGTGVPASAQTLSSGQSPLVQGSAANSFVANFGGNSITEYATGANGNQVPVATITGPDTGLVSPFAVALDPAGDLFVVNRNEQVGSSSITEYAKGATGDATPIATISGANARLSQPDSVTVDRAGNLFVAEQNNVILEFAQGAKGDVAPHR